MKLLIVSSAFQPAWDWGGPVRSMWNLTRGLAELGVDVTVLATNARQQGIVDVPMQRNEEGVRILTFPVFGKGKIKSANRFGISPELWFALTKHTTKTDLVHLNGFWGASQIMGAVACWLCGKPYVVSTRGNLQKDAIHDKRVKKELAFFLGVKKALRQASAIHYTTDLERQWSPEWAGEYKSFIVPNPLEIRPIADGITFREKNGISDRTLLLGAFGRIHRRKGFDILIPAIGRMVAKGKDLTLLVAGPDEGYIGELRRLVRKEGIEKNIILLGEIKGDVLDEAYAASDMLVLPAHGENFGNVVVEAALQGTPAMVSEHLGLMDWVRGEDAGIVLPLDPEVWAKAFGKLVREEIAIRWQPDRIRTIAKECFSIKSVAQQMIDEYKGILVGKGKRAMK